MATTLQQVANRAGVSLATASRVLNGSARTPRPDVAERVHRAAIELGYVPNAQAQALARASTGLLGLVVQDIADPYFSSIAAGVQAVAHDHQRQLLLASTNRSPSAEHDAVSAFMAYRTEAIILAGSRRLGADSGEEQLVTLCQAYERNGGRVAVVGQSIGAFTTVSPRNADGARQLARRLVATGHRRFAVVEGPRWLRTSVDRCDAFRDEIATCPDARVEWSVVSEFNRDGAYAAAKERLAEHTVDGEPLCIFASTDVMALGVLSAARDLGLDVPDQIGVAGFDDIPTLRDSSPTLTTVRIDLEGIGRSAAALVTDPAAAVPREFGAEPILRESTRLDR